MGSVGFESPKWARKRRKCGEKTQLRIIPMMQKFLLIFYKYVKDDYFISSILFNTNSKWLIKICSSCFEAELLYNRVYTQGTIQERIVSLYKTLKIDCIAIFDFSQFIFGHNKCAPIRKHFSLYTVNTY